MTLGSRDTAPFGLGLQPSPGGLGRIRNAVLDAVIRRAVLRPVQKQITRLLAERGYPDPGSLLLDWYRRAESLSQLTVPSFEYPRSDLPPNIRCVGPLLPAGGGAVPDWWGDLDGSRPVVHVTQGTLDNNDLGQLLMPTLAALADEPVLVVAATGGKPVSELPGPIPANARVASMLPYHELLPRTDVLVTNGGYGGVQFALTYGVPMVVAGTTEDKPEVAARVAWSGVGINLRSRRPRPARIRHAVRRILTEPAYRDASQRLQTEAENLNAMQSILGLLELPTG